jgi:hypothetical protein
MKAFKIWVARHPLEGTNLQIVHSEPDTSCVLIQSMWQEGEEAWAEWVECVCIPIGGSVL